MPSNYRPISLTSVCSKVMEHVVFHSIMEHLQNHSVLSDFQHGFRPGYSCQTQLIDFIENIQHAMDQQKQVDVILLDFSKAFDTVPHQCLLTKLAHYGIKGDIYKWINFWLSQCTQHVVVDGESSELVRVESGVPQGTVLGPLMFLLYINDITNGLTSNIRLFADDCIIYRTIYTREDSIHLQEDLNKVFKWTKCWQMKFNVQKCVVLWCTRSHSPKITDYTIDGHTLKLKHHLV